MTKVERVDQSRNGVRVIVTRHPGVGSIVEASCQCFGFAWRAHSNERCPVFRAALRTRAVRESGSMKP